MHQMNKNKHKMKKKYEKAFVFTARKKGNFEGELKCNMHYMVSKKPLIFPKNLQKISDKQVSRLVPTYHTSNKT